MFLNNQISWTSYITESHAEFLKFSVSVLSYVFILRFSTKFVRAGIILSLRESSALSLLYRLILSFFFSLSLSFLC